MKVSKIYTKILLATLAVGASMNSYSGNEDRVGSAGATELLINPWGRSAAFGSAGVASGEGLSSIYTNIAGLAFTNKTQIVFDYNNWLGGSGISVNSAGIAQRINETTVLSLGVVGLTMGDIEITTEDQPEGGIGYFSPKLSNINLGFAHEFSNSIYAGLNVKAISNSISNVRTNSVAFDAGIKYVTGEEDQIKFGITLKNVGPSMTAKGDGLAYQMIYEESGEEATVEQRSQSYELPSLLALGASYDFNFTEVSKLTIAGAFYANSFSNDQISLGADYGMEIDKAAFHVTAGYVYEKGIFSQEIAYGSRLTALSGFSAGLSVDARMGENDNRIGFQYAYRTANPFNGIHTIGVTLDIR